MAICPHACPWGLEDRSSTQAELDACHSWQGRCWRQGRVGGRVLNCVPAPPGSPSQTVMDGVAPTDARTVGPRTVFFYSFCFLVKQRRWWWSKNGQLDEIPSVMHPIGQYLSHSDSKNNFWVAPAGVSVSTKLSDMHFFCFFFLNQIKSTVAAVITLNIKHWTRFLWLTGSWAWLNQEVWVSWNSPSCLLVTELIFIFNQHNNLHTGA